MTEFTWLGFLPYDEKIIEADLNGESPFDKQTDAKRMVGEMIDKL